MPGGDKESLFREKPNSSWEMWKGGGYEREFFEWPQYTIKRFRLADTGKRTAVARNSRHREGFRKCRHPHHPENISTMNRCLYSMLEFYIMYYVGVLFVDQTPNKLIPAV
jgi:hypothetical protein